MSSTENPLMASSLPADLSDTELIAAVARLAHSERDATTRRIAHLAEFDLRKLHLGAGFSSLFAYCCEVLHLSENATGNRIAAARAARRFPIVLDMLACGSVNLTTVRLLAPHLTDTNHRDLLDAAANRRKSDVEELIAHRFPRPEIVSSVRRLPAPRSVAAPSLTPAPSDPVVLVSLVAPGPSPATGRAGHSAPPDPTLLPPSPPARRALIAALAPGRYEIRFTASASTRDKLRRAQELLRHSIPSGEPAEIFDRALTALLQDLARKKFAALRQRSRESPVRPTAPSSRHVPAGVKRAVWLRDVGQCAFVAKSGRRCRERGFLEFHHLTPYGVGGEATRQNIELRCRSHNAYEAELFYGARR